MTSDDELVEVRFLRFPVRVSARATEHFSELRREFALLAASTPTDCETVPARLLALIDALGRRYPPQAQHEAERQAALDRGDKAADLAVKVPASGAGASVALNDMLDEADEFCRTGALLTLAAPPDVAAFRRWYLHEVVAQVEGAEPTPWPGGLD
ncbi:MAG TPA: hypothetical protein VLW53_14435 [Candidatus Eisenbacteria bacterium]|nr:hypothetical protein [Candidatus Eisenbacteria bacterium]